MADQLSKQIDIARHIIEGSVTIDSVKEFQSILQIFPNDPILHRAYADLLVRKRAFDAAIQSYDQAVKLFIDSGSLLQAIVCQARKCRLRRPVLDETQRFYDDLCNGRYHEIPVNVFLRRLSPPELVSLMNRMELIRLPAGKTVKKIGDAENALYFIVSGKLKATTYATSNKNDSAQRRSTLHLTENDFFGDIYPLNANKLSQAYTRTVSQVELARFRSEKMQQICRMYANVELGIIDLFKARSETEDRGALRLVRKADRHKLPIRMNLKIWPDASSHHGLVLDGRSRDVSVGGMCIMLDTKYTHASAIYKNIKNAKIEVSLALQAMTVNVLGAIVWSKEASYKGEKTVALGIQFEEMSPQLSGLLVVFANIINNTS